MKQTMSEHRNSSRFIPIIIAVSVVIGILVGVFYSNHFAGNRLSIINTSSNKLNDLLRIVDNQYVDSVDMTDLVEKAMPQILAELDPHSMYISAKDLEDTNAELKGSFSGIGVAFTIQHDTIYISDVIQGGPSEKVGLMAGDRIITVDDSLFVGEVVTNSSTMHKLKGPKGTTVKLGILRRGVKNLIPYTIVRGDIPVKSVDAAYMLSDKVGYLHINKFGETTYSEMIVGLVTLQQQGMKELVIDLRDNSGGYMGAAIQMVNEFLPKNRLVVYTEGRKSPRQDYRADGRGTFQNLPLVVLINESSASASEIFSGAIQDNDRGTIIGRRSFGKGLVQQPIDFRDGSAIRLTIARYYTPSGRCIQKPYTSGKDEAYEFDLQTRFDHGEFFSQDSIKQNEEVEYHTSIGRPVYGGGGIMPDIFVPQDTIGYTSYYFTAVNNRLTVEFAFQYTDENRAKLATYSTVKELHLFLMRQSLLEKFAQFAESRGLQRRNLMIQKSRKLLERTLYGNIIYNMMGTEEYMKFLNESDPTVLKAAEVLEAGEATPKAPAKKEVKEDAKKKR
jgi:carboxyl-terminal processing protease